MDKERINLLIGLTTDSLEWIMILRQIGVNWESVDCSEKPEAFQYAVIIVPSSMNIERMKIIFQYVKSGGAAIFNNLPQRDLNTYAGLKIINNENLFQYGNGFFINLSVKIFSGSKAQRKYFDAGEGFPAEIVSKRQMRNLRLLITGTLKKLFALRKLPFIQKAYYPADFRSVFSFRIDVDNYHPANFNSLVENSIPYKDQMTWFVCCHDFYDNKHSLKKLVDLGYDVQSHGFEHIPFTGKKWSKINLEKSHRFLSGIGAKPVGFAGPAGFHGDGLQKTLEDLGYLYSSEFSLDYDNFPFFPICGNNFSAVLQTPIHPICLGSFIATTDIKADDPIILKYFEKIIAQKYSLGEPILLYGHPTNELGAWPSVMTHIMEIGGNLKSVWYTSFTKFAEWWKKRDSVEFAASVSAMDYSKLYLSCDGGAPSEKTGFDICNTNGESARIFTSNEELEIKWTDLKFEPFSVDNLGKSGNTVNPPFSLNYACLRRKYIEKVLWGLSRLDWLKKSLQLTFERN